MSHAEEGALVAHHLILRDCDQRGHRVFGAEDDFDIVAFLHPVPADDRVVLLRMLLGADKPLVGTGGVVGLEEGGREDAPPGEAFDLERAGLHQDDPGLPAHSGHDQGFGHHEREGETQRIGRPDVVIDPVDHNVRSRLAGLDGDGVGPEGVVEGLGRIAFGVDDLDAECPVVIPCHRGDHRHAEPLDIIHDRIGLQGVGEHHIFLPGVDVPLPGAGGKQEACQRDA